MVIENLARIDFLDHLIHWFANMLWSLPYMIHLILSYMFDVPYRLSHQLLISKMLISHMHVMCHILSVSDKSLTSYFPSYTFLSANSQSVNVSAYISESTETHTSLLINSIMYRTFFTYVILYTSSVLTCPFAH